MATSFIFNIDMVLHSDFNISNVDLWTAPLTGIFATLSSVYDAELFVQSFNPLFKTFRSCGRTPFVSNFLVLGEGALCRPAYSDAVLAEWDEGFRLLQEQGLVKEATNPILEPITSKITAPRPRVECPKESIINDDMIAWWKQEHEDMAMIYALDLSPEQVEANIQARIVAGDSPEMIESYRAHQIVREDMRPKHQEVWYILQGMTLEEEVALKRSTALGIASPMDPNWDGVHFSQDKPAKDVFTFAGKSVDLNDLTVEQADQIVEYLPGAEAERFKGMENVAAVYHKSIPTGKVSYPEPLVASASFTHNDIGFIHILQYQYWLWFIFIFLIIFFFLTFLCVVRWCNIRNRPRRETRGVSRSKCGDLITACVPVSWATSIIVSESTDAIDYFDGFSTGELVVGVRAYQWGWEYYYPKTVDLNYSVKPSYSSFVGNSIKYNGASSKTLAAGHIWRHYQNKETDVVNTPAHLLLLPLDNDRLLTFMNFNQVGSNTLDPASAFKKIRTYSKVYTTNLVHTPTTFSDKYVNINSLYLDDWSSLGDSNWGVRRQHNLTSAQSLADSYASSLDSGSFDRFVRHTFATPAPAQGAELFTTNPLTPAHKLGTTATSSVVSTQSAIGGLSSHSAALANVTRFPSVVLEFNNNSDAKSTNYPMRKLLNTKVWGSTYSPTHAVPGLFDVANTSRLPRVESPFGESSGLLHSERAIRIQSGFSPNASHKNLSLGGNTIDSNMFGGSASRRFGNLDSYHGIRAAGSPDLAVFNRLASNRMLAGGSYPAIGSTNPTFTPLDYDHVVSTSLDVNSSASEVTFNRNRNIPSEDMGTFISLLKSSNASDLDTLRTAYWRMFYSFANPTLRLDAGLAFNKSASTFYMPLVTNYAEYDFRNDQSAELLEEAFWETSYSAYSHYDYLQMANSETKGAEFVDDNLIFEPMFYSSNFHDTAKLSPKGLYLTGGKPNTDTLLSDVSVVGEYYANGIQFDDSVVSAKLMPTHHFGLFPLAEGANAQEESYSELRDLVAVSAQASNIFSLANTDYLVPRSYLSVLNSFRADFEDAAWAYDSDDNNSRVSNPLILRSTARNSIVTYNALQKVFRARMEEARANVQLADFANLGAKHPFIAAPATKYTSLLGKNRASFFNVNYFAERSLPVFNEVSMLVKPLNIDFFDFPFLVAGKSDMSRYFWLDWYANWGLIEVQPASYSKYSLTGVPFIRNSFDYSVDEGDNNAATEGYFNKLSRARRNYLPNWQHTSWQAAQDLVWSSDERLLSLLAPRSGEVSSVMNMLNSMSWYTDSLFFAKNTSEVFTPTSSGVGMNTRPSWRPFASTQAYYYHMSQLSDLLTRREFLYRKYLESTSRLVSVPKTISAAPTNPLLREVKAAFAFIDPMTYNSEYSREFYYTSSEFVKFTLFKDLLLKLSSTASTLPINHSMINDYLFFYMFGSDNSSKLGRNEELYKNQFRPLRKGVSNMLRLHASGAIAMPIEIRLQVLASSRDVIHSWAIPSAGIKIDCIPGYTSHRIMIFLVSGIYWGQCMEICGRYHHWMPIVIYFMKRDLFFLWCTHFVFRSNGARQWDVTDKQYADYVRFVSYDRSAWLSEVSREM